jgi:hypothetical protein
LDNPSVVVIWDKLCASRALIENSAWIAESVALGLRSGSHRDGVE